MSLHETPHPHTKTTFGQRTPNRRVRATPESEQPLRGQAGLPPWVKHALAPEVVADGPLPGYALPKGAKREGLPMP